MKFTQFILQIVNDYWTSDIQICWTMSAIYVCDLLVQLVQQLVRKHQFAFNFLEKIE